MIHRLQQLRSNMKEQAIEALLITNPTNRKYISGFTGSSGLILITETENILITDFRYVSQVKTQSPHYKMIQHTGPILDTVVSECRRMGVQTVAFEQDHITFAIYQDLQKKLGSVKLEPSSGCIELLRMQKDDAELAIMQEAARIADTAFSNILNVIKPGMKEKEIALQLEIDMRRMGASSSSFDIIVASGERSALPHGTASDKVLAKGELVTMDFGAYYKGYASDITRTIMLGKPNEKQKEIYDIVLEAGNRTIEALRPGITGKEADAVARDYISAHGYGEYFGHSTGHGLGLDVHEAPGLSTKGNITLQPGMVVTVEPGIYLPTVGGVRIEDDVVITAEGHHVLTHSTKELIMID
nr:Xaa-Pro peptidase family protein [Polycladospora coralii]